MLTGRLRLLRRAAAAPASARARARARPLAARVLAWRRLSGPPARPPPPPPPPPRQGQQREDATSGNGKAPVSVDEETPAARLERLEDELDEVDDPTSVEFLQKNKEVAKQRWVVARKAVRAAKAEQEKANKEGDGYKKAAAAEKVELAQAEAELAQAKAELAQAEADGDKEAAKALNNKVASFNDTVTELNKTLHARRAKRLRVEASGVSRESAAAPPAANDPNLLGREVAVEQLKKYAKQNYSRRANENNKAVLTILAAVGHVRVGKTRLGREAARAIEALRDEPEYSHWTAPVYLKIDFQNGSTFTQALDGVALDDKAATGVASRLLGARMAAAVRSLYLEEQRTEIEAASFEQLRDADVGAGQVVEALVRHFLTLADNPEKACVPIVIHVDEYGHYVRDAGDGKRREAAKSIISRMARCIGTELMMANGVKDEALRDKFFVVPIFTGTSYNDLRLQVSGFPVHYLPLPLLSFDQSKELLEDFWARHRPGTEMPGPKTPEGNALLLALSDAGGFPGFVEMLALQSDTPAEQVGVASLTEAMRNYSRNALQPPRSLWSALVRLALAREPVLRNDVVRYTNTDKEMKVGEALDRGYVSVLVSNGDEASQTGSLKLTVPMGVVRMWRLEAGVFDLQTVPDPTPSSPWTWQQFEIMHASFVASLLAALFRVGDLIADTPAAPVTLQRLLRGAEPAGAECLAGRVIVGGPRELPWGVAARGIVHEAKQVFSSVDGEDSVSLEMDGVHLCANNNHVVDAYVNLELQKVSDKTSSPATVFFQYKHSKLDADGRLTVAQMNSERERLDKYLEKRQESVWRHRQVVLVFVTNREVRAAAGEEALPGLLYVGRKQLSRHLGPELAGRGLVPTATARRVDED